MSRPENMFALMSNAIKLFERCTARMSGREEHSVQVVRASLSLALTTIAVFEQHCPDTKEHRKSSCKDRAFSDLDKTLREWVGSASVIGKAMFGGYTESSWGLRSSIKLARVKEEIMVRVTLHTDISIHE